jgi:hypothetical protein
VAPLHLARLTWLESVVKLEGHRAAIPDRAARIGWRGEREIEPPAEVRKEQPWLAEGSSVSRAHARAAAGLAGPTRALTNAAAAHGAYVPLAA